MLKRAAGVGCGLALLSAVGGVALMALVAAVIELTAGHAPDDFEQALAGTIVKATFSEDSERASRSFSEARKLTDRLVGACVPVSSGIRRTWHDTLHDWSTASRGYTRSVTLRRYPGGQTTVSLGESTGMTGPYPQVWLECDPQQLNALWPAPESDSPPSLQTVRLLARVDAFTSIIGAHSTAPGVRTRRPSRHSDLGEPPRPFHKELEEFPVLPRDIHLLLAPDGSRMGLRMTADARDIVSAIGAPRGRRELPAEDVTWTVDLLKGMPGGLYLASEPPIPVPEGADLIDWLNARTRSVDAAMLGAVAGGTGVSASGAIETKAGWLLVYPLPQGD